MKYKAYATETTGGHLTLYVIDAATDKCIYAHSGYEHRDNHILDDMLHLQDESKQKYHDLSDWDQNDIEMVEFWNANDSYGHEEVIATLEDGVIQLYPEDMGGAGREAFLKLVRRNK